MYKSRINVFIGSFVFIFFVSHATFQWLGNRQEKLFQNEIKILHAEIENRFKLMIENNESILMVSSTVTSDWKNLDKTYEGLADKILLNFDEILGLNFINPEGVLIKVAPFEKNNRALGKTTQNIDGLRHSLENGEKLFVSPPFDLYQGIRGIGFYTPVFEGNKFMGWLAIAQGLDRFMEKFVDSKFLGAYHLIIKDAITGRNYYASATIPPEEEGITVNQQNIKGRMIHFVSWRKAKFQKRFISWTSLILLSLILSILSTLSYWAIEQRIRTRKELENIEALLRATFNSTSNNLNSIQEQLELIKMGSGFVPLNKISSHVAYLSTLIDQLRALVKVSESKEPESIESTSILPMIGDLSKILTVQLQQKDLRLSFDPQDFINVEIFTKNWIMVHGIFENVLNYFIQISSAGDNIRVVLGPDEKNPTIIVLNFTQFHSKDIFSGGNLPESLEKAYRTINYQKGTLQLENKDDGAMAIITLSGILRFKSSPVVSS